MTILIKRIEEMDAAASTAPAAGTTSGNIAFIPADYGAKKKKVIEPKVPGVEEMTEKELDEAISQDFNELINVLTDDLEKIDEIKQLKDLRNVFYSLFPKVQVILPREKVLINISNYAGGIASILKEINKRFSNDAGYVERITSAIEDRLSLTSLKIFKDYSFLAGLSLQTTFLDVTVRLDAKCNMALENSYLLTVSDEEVVQDVKHFRDLKVVGNTIQPFGDKITSVLHNLKSTISAQKGE